MASCEQGYICEVCQEEVEGVTVSDLYLRYVIGEVRAADLPGAAERHLPCNPVLSQFIVDPAFEPVLTEGPFDKRTLDAAFVADREALVTRGWRRLQEVHGAGLPISAYPLEEFRSSGVVPHE